MSSARWLKFKVVSKSRCGKGFLTTPAAWILKIVFGLDRHGPAVARGQKSECQESHKAAKSVASSPIMTIELFRFSQKKKLTGILC